MRTLPAFLLFLATWIVTYVTSMTANKLTGFKLTPEELSGLRPGTMEFLSLLSLLGVLMPFLAAIVGFFCLKWYLVLLAWPLALGGGAVLNSLLSFGLHRFKIDMVIKSLLLLALSIGMCVLNFVKL